MTDESFEEKRKKLELAMAAINRSYGEKSVYFFNDHEIQDTAAVPTGAFSLDVALGVGGIPLGRIIEIYGPEASGKSTLCQRIVAGAQKQGLTTAYIDMEHAIDPFYAKELGMDFDTLIFAQPMYGEQAIDIVEELIKTEAINLIVVDSVAALIPKAELEGTMEDQHMGLQARLMSKALRKLTPLAAANNVTIIFVNQIREKIGIMFGNPETTPGGRALRFFASVRIELRKVEDLKSKEGDLEGIRVRAKVLKNKVGKPFTEARFMIFYGKGIDYESSLLDAAVTAGLLNKAGAWYSYNGESVGQGDRNTAAWLRENPEIASEIRKQLLTPGEEGNEE